MKSHFAPAAFVAALCSNPAIAITIEPLPGSAPQSTRVNAYFPSTIGVVVRDDAGAPLPNIDVEFDQQFGEGEPQLRFMQPGRRVIKTDANGVASTRHIAAYTIPGPARLYAYVTGASHQFAPLTILPGPAVSVEYEPPANMGQLIQQGHAFNYPWTVRAFDADGLPVPYAIVAFSAQAQPGPFVRFNGQAIGYAAADADGIAESPASSAGSVLGDGRGEACAFPLVGCKQFNFTVVDFPPPAQLLLMSYPYLTVQEGRRVDQPFRVLALDATDQPLAGVPLTFRSPPCGSFEGAANVTVLTDATGYGTSPLFQAVAAGPTQCNFTIDLGSNPSVGWAALPMLIFRGEDVTAHYSPSNVLETTANLPFEFWVAYTALDETGAAVTIDARDVEVRVVGKHNGASADLLDIPPFDGSSVETLIKMQANKKHGAYMIGVTRDDVVLWFVVDQRKH